MVHETNTYTDCWLEPICSLPYITWTNTLWDQAKYASFLVCNRNWKADMPDTLHVIVYHVSWRDGLVV